MSPASEEGYIQQTRGQDCTHCPTTTTGAKISLSICISSHLSTDSRSLANMKASLRGRVAPWARDCAGRAEGEGKDAPPPPRRPDRQTTPAQPKDDGDLFPLALWNACACATNPISNAAGAGAGAAEAIMCNQGSPVRVRMRSRVVEVEDEDEDEESLWTPGKPAAVHCC